MAKAAQKRFAADLTSISTNVIHSPLYNQQNMFSKILTVTTLLLATFVTSTFAQSGKEKKSVKDIVEQLPEMLIGQGTTAPDSNANRLRNDNLSILLPELWYEKGLQTIIEFKLTKTDYEPLSNTFPVPDKKIAQAVTINMGTTKKTSADKRAEVVAGIKKHMLAYYKEAGVSVSADELNNQLKSAEIGTDKLQTEEGTAAELYFYNDIESKQSSLIVLMIVPAANGTSNHFIQVAYTRYNYDTTLPEDINEWKTFVYESEQQAYIDFTKGILKTLRIRQ